MKERGEGFWRLNQVLEIIPISRSGWWKGFPKIRRMDNQTPASEHSPLRTKTFWPRLRNLSI